MSNTSFKAVIEEFPTMLIGINKSGQIKAWNKASEEMTGYLASEAEAELGFLNRLSTNGFLPEKIHTIQNENKDQSVTYNDIELTCNDGSIKLFRFQLKYRVNPIIDGLNMWVIGFDETEHTMLNNAMKLSMARFEMISQATNDAIWEWDIKKDTLWWGEGLRDLFGHPEGGQYTSFQWWADKVHPEDRDRVVRKLRDSAENGNLAWSDEYQFKRKDGTYCTVQDKGMSICESDGQPIRMIGGMLDITEKKLYEQSLIVKNQQLAEYAFFNSHKVRAPLARLLSCVEILQIESNLDADTVSILKAIKLSADELDKEVREIGSLLSMDSNLGKTPS